MSIRIRSLHRLFATLVFAFIVGRVYPGSFLDVSQVIAASQTSSSWGLSFRTDTPTLVTWWNHYSTAPDSGFSFGGPYASMLTAGTTALIYNNGGGTTPGAIATAKQYGLKNLIFNLEGIQGPTACQTLLNGEIAAKTLIHQAGMRFIFAPTGWLTKRCYSSYPALFQNADIYFFQSEFMQGTDSNIVADIQTIVHAAKMVKPGLPVWVQVSVAPNVGPAPTPAQLESLITSIETGPSGYTPDQVVIFFFSDPTTVEKVIQSFRAYHA